MSQWPYRSIRLACKAEQVDVDWDGTFSDLARLFTEEFTSNETPSSLQLLDKGVCRVYAQRTFRLWDTEKHVAFEGYDLSAVKDGDTIQVNYELYSRMLDQVEERRGELRRQRLARKCWASASRKLGSGRSPRGMGVGSGLGSQSGSETNLTLSGPSESHLTRSGFGTWTNLTGKESAFVLLLRRLNVRDMYSSGGTRGVVAAPGTNKSAPWKVRLWSTMDEPTSSTSAAVVSIAILFLILYSTTTFCLETLHGFYTPSLTPFGDFWKVSEAACIAVFSLEAILRLVSCPDLRGYLSSPMNIIDLVAISPFYIELVIQAASSDGEGDAEVPGLAVFRVVRLVRVFRLLKVSKGSISLFDETMTNSAKPLNMLLGLVSIAVVVCASLMYFIERGRFNVTMQFWERPHRYMCEVMIAADPGGPALGAAPTYSAGEREPCERVSLHPDSRAAVFRCPYNYKKNPACVVVYEQSPFSSIVATFWWTWVTMTTVGYGDLYPTTLLGKMFGMLVMFFGILVIALPITVIGSNFATAYHKEQAALDVEFKLQQAANRRKAAETAHGRASSAVTEIGGSFRSTNPDSSPIAASAPAGDIRGDFDDVDHYDRGHDSPNDDGSNGHSAYGTPTANG
mmetsp:Transcript_25930/g.64940  ORF Transcript_25930/g.64940 Transcript_25930/m.64940 type:complete len:626 (-) Transcript_25930:107-1984(-)